MPEPETVGRLREMYDAFNEGDVDEALRHVHPEVELRRPEPGPHAGQVIVGVDAVREWLKPDAFDEQRSRPLEFIHADDDVAVVRIMAYGRGAGSGIEVELEAFHVWRLRDGVVVRLESYGDRDRALEAAGLAE